MTNLCRITGRVDNAFILRGHFFAHGDNVDLNIYDNGELEFVKPRLADMQIHEVDRPPIQKDKPKEVKANGTSTKGKRNK